MQFVKLVSTKIFTKTESNCIRIKKKYTQKMIFKNNNNNSQYTHKFATDHMAYESCKILNTQLELQVNIKNATSVREKQLK